MLISADTVPASNSPAEEPVPNTELTSETGGLLAVLVDSTLMLGVVFRQHGFLMRGGHIAH